MSKECILYLGNYLTEQIVKKRKLPTNNVAGSNRILRLSEALSISYDVKIISPAVTLRIGFNPKKIILNKELLNFNKNINIVFVKTLAIPILGLVYSHISYFFEVISNIKRNKVKTIIIYNFGSLNLLILIYLKFFLPKVKIINNIEDISILSAKDFSFKSEDNLLQQIFFSFSMKFTAFMSNAYLVPTERFFSYLPEKKNKLVITGCIRVKKFVEKTSIQNLEFLFAGKIAFEHGVKEFVDCLKLYDTENNKLDIKFHVTGTGPKTDWLTEQLKSIKNIDVKYYGFVSNKEYKDILDKVSVCIALQKPDGRHANFKTPSKVYEYLGNSKIVIATNVGDFKEIGSDIIRICEPFTIFNLKSIINELILKKDEVNQLSKKINTYAYSHYDYSNINKKIESLINEI